jgi:hypothetical protein
MKVSKSWYLCVLCFSFYLRQKSDQPTLNLKCRLRVYSIVESEYFIPHLILFRPTLCILKRGKKQAGMRDFPSKSVRNKKKQDTLIKNLVNDFRLALKTKKDTQKVPFARLKEYYFMIKFCAQGTP